SITASTISAINPDPGQSGAEVEHLRFRLDFLASLLRLRIVIEDFEADGLSLTVRRPVGSGFAEPVEDLLQGRRNLDDELQAGFGFDGRWLSDPRVRISSVTLVLDDGKNRLRHIGIPLLDVLYRRALFQAAGCAMQGGATRQLARFALVGQHFFRGDFTRH